MAIITKIIISLVKTYIAKLATTEFAHWALMQIAEAIVASTKTPEDDKWLEKIKEIIEAK